MKKIRRILIKVVIGGLLVFIGLIGLYHVSYYTDFRYYPTEEQLYGRWELIRLSRSFRTRNIHRRAYSPDHESWSDGTFIQFNPDGTFIEQNFFTPEFNATGTWELNTPNLILTLDGIDEGIVPFASNRGVRIYTDGLIPYLVDHSHRQLAYYGDTFFRMAYQRYNHGFRYIFIPANEQDMDGN